MKTITDSEIEKLALQNGYSNDFHIDVFRDGFKACRSQIEDTQTEQWIDVAAEKPENFISVLGITKRGTFVVCETIDDDFWISQGGGRVGVIAWQPLPQPPAQANPTERKEEK